MTFRISKRNSSMKKGTKKQSENAIKWIETLLSRKYKQGRERLGDEKTGFCCWGLGCFIVNMKYIPEKDWETDLAEKVGFLNTNGDIFPSLYGYKNLAEVNDETTAGFKRIGKHLIKYSENNFLPNVSKAIKMFFSNTKL